MAVAAELEGQPAYLVAHYPHVDAEQARFEAENRARLADTRKAHEASHPRWRDALVLWALGGGPEHGHGQAQGSADAYRVSC